MRVPNAAKLGFIDADFVAAADRFVNWMPYDDTGHPYSNEAENVDLYVIDLGGDVTVGSNLCRWLNSERPHSRCILLVDRLAAISCNLRISDFSAMLMKPVGAETIELAVANCLAGKSFCDPALKDLYPVHVIPREQLAAFAAHKVVSLEVNGLEDTPQAIHARNKLNRAWFSPKIELNSSALVSFRIGAKGVALEPILLRSSGERVFDDAAMLAINRVVFEELPIGTEIAASFDIKITEINKAETNPT